MRIGDHRPIAPTRPPSVPTKSRAKARADSFGRVRRTPFVQGLKAATKSPVKASTPPATFGSLAPSVPPGTTPDLGPGATPQETVAYLLSFEERSGNEGDQANLFVQGLEPHLADAAWLQGFYSALGTERAARLVNTALHHGSYSDWPPEMAQEHARIAVTSLTALHASGQLNEGDMDALGTQWATGAREPGGTFNSGIALALGEVGFEHEAFQTLFVSSAVDLATSDAIGADDADDVAAAGAWVLAHTSPDNQLRVLHEIQQNGQLPTFVRLSTQGPAEVPTLLNMTRDAYDPVNGEWNHEIETRYDGMARLVFGLSFASVRDSFQGPSPVSTADIRLLQADVFAEAVKVLGDGRERTWHDSVRLKDGLARIFVEDFDALMGTLLSENMATYRHPDREALIEGMQGFFENTLFSPPLGHQSERLTAFLGDKLMTMAGDIRAVDGAGLTDEQVAARYGDGVDRVDLTHQSGLLTGSLLGGLRQADERIAANAEATANALKLVLDIGLSFVPGGATLAGLGDAALGKIFGKLTKEAIDQIKDLTVEEARQRLIERGEARIDVRGATEEIEGLAEGTVYYYGEWAEAVESGLGEN
jgi:hypothetical protein